MSTSSRVDSGAELLIRDGSWSNVNVEGAFEGSVITTSSSGARLTLGFTGTSIAVFGMAPAATIAQAPSISFYYIDGELVASQLIAAQDTAQNGVRFFRSPKLAPGSHTFTVEYRANSGSTHPLSIDYFEVYGQSSHGDPTSLSPTRTVSSQSPSSAPPSSSLPTQPNQIALSPPSGVDSSPPSFSLYARVSSSGDLSPTAVVATNENVRGEGAPLGPIIGGAVGGLALVALLILLTIFFRKRRREQRNANHLAHSFSASAFTAAQEPPRPREGSGSSSIATSPSSSLTPLSEKAELSESSTDSAPLQPSPSPLPSSIAVSPPSNSRHTMYSIQTSRTAGTALPEYDPRISTLASTVGRAEPLPPAYQM
ncbi:hypothetical protein BKA70DRAFT_1479218 [Coprinopsis sp. MPI-PUGE-AT-0042]|nr:hypothetical protein BKA70DRAFT_1479218 [Coprinopsis sp. MPI-PUGE-AT-0042]